MKYQIIYADPPYRYNDRMNMEGVHGKIQGAGSFYKTMTVEEIKTLPIKNICSDNCYLFLWVTMPMLQEGLSIIKAWGFKYKTCGFTWLKTTQKSKIHFGGGHYTRGNAELCLLGKKGKGKVINHSVSQIVESPVRAHSQKPAIVREKIVQLIGDVPRIELFARQKVEGWNSIGFDIDGCDIRESLR